MDPSAAFDSADHDIILCNPENFGKTLFALSRFRSYLTNRNVRVLEHDEHSEIGNMRHEKSQGTILGAVLFTIHTATLQYKLNNYNVLYHFYADDTQM